MRRTQLVWLALSHLTVAAVVWMLVRPAAPVHTGPIDFTEEITVRTDGGDAKRYRPHAVQVDNVPTYRAEPPPHQDAPVTVVTLDGGRVKVACTEVTK